METLVKTKWAIDPSHSEVHFKVKHLVISTVTGSFRKFEGSVQASSQDFSDAEIDFTAEVDSITTNQVDRDAHLKSPEFFDMANHPKIKFKSKSIKKKGDSEFALTGDLTIRGVTKEVTLDVEAGGITKDLYGNTRAGFEVTGKINRKDFGLTWSALTETGGMVVADDIKININIELIKQ